MSEANRTMNQKVFRTGNSLAVTIPSEFASTAGIQAGDEVNVKEDPSEAKITLQFSGTQQLPLDTNFFKHKKNKI